LAEKDITEKILADYNDVFSDIMNVLLFDGKALISEVDLESTKDKSMYKIENAIHEQERDLTKFWKKENVYLSVFGLEHQTEYDPEMPLRVIGYDGAVYRSQYSGGNSNTKSRNNGFKKNKYPVITVVLNFSNKRWGNKKQLSDCFDIDENLKPYFSDYGINVIDVSYLSDEKLNMFKSDFKIVADYFVQLRKNKEYIPSKEEIIHVDAIYILRRGPRSGKIS